MPEENGLEIAYRYDPAEELDGDFVHVQSLGEKRVGIGVYSLSVKGPEFVPLNEIVLEKLTSCGERGLDPKETACELNLEMNQVLGDGDYLSMIYGVIDLQEGTFSFVNAGQPPPIELRPFDDGPSELLHSNGIVIGQDDGSLFRVLLEPRVVSLQPRHPLILYTEGMVELVDADGQEFGSRSFLQTLDEFSRHDSAYLVEMVETRVCEFVGTESRTRDLLLVAFRVDGGAARSE
jgi:sigma-B regulation protein RsbU (phosphoserine phosphatase)